jgi:hypothetical protein
VLEKNLFRWATLVDRLRFSYLLRNSKEVPYSTPLLWAIDPTSGIKERLPFAWLNRLGRWGKVVAMTLPSWWETIYLLGT